MFTRDLGTEMTNLELVSPNVERDAPLGVQWTSGAFGYETLRLMGNAEHSIEPGTMATERRRVQSFLDDEEQYNWMIELDGRVVGSIWVELIPKPEIEAPMVSIMIGDPAVRGKGIGNASMRAVIEYMRDSGFRELHSRHLVENVASEKMLSRLGFALDGLAYASKDDGLRWQNRVITFKT